MRWELVLSALLTAAVQADTIRWVKAWRGSRQTPADTRRLHADMDERAGGGPRIE